MVFGRQCVRCCHVATPVIGFPTGHSIRTERGGLTGLAQPSGFTCPNGHPNGLQSYLRFEGGTGARGGCHGGTSSHTEPEVRLEP